MRTSIVKTAQIVYPDDEAPLTCGDPSSEAITTFLTGTIEGDQLNSTMRWARCGTVHHSFQGFEITWYLNDQGDLDPSNDVRTNSFGETFKRVS